MRRMCYPIGCLDRCQGLRSNGEQAPQRAAGNVTHKRAGVLQAPAQMSLQNALMIKFGGDSTLG